MCHPNPEKNEVQCRGTGQWTEHKFLCNCNEYRHDSFEVNFRCEDWVLKVTENDYSCYKMTHSL